MNKICSWIKPLSQLFIILLACTWAMQSYASLEEALITPKHPQANQKSGAPPVLVPPAPQINAKGYVLMDARSGAILASKNMNHKMQPASLTKIMTLYIVANELKQGRIKLSDKVRISKEAWHTGGSRLFLKVGSRVPLKTLIEGVVVASGNDACVAISQYIAGSQDSFAHMMNMIAKRLGMKNTHYVDPTGLPRPEHYSTPYDMAVLTRDLINTFPKFYKNWFHLKWITFNNIRQPNRNRLLWRDPYVDGVKTGHTKEAGYCLVSSAKREGMRLIAVVMGAPTDNSRDTYSQALYNWGFRFFSSHKLYAGKTTLAKPRVWLGKSKFAYLGLDRDLYVTIPEGTLKKLKTTVKIDKKLKAPIEKGQRYGTVNVLLNGKVIAKAPLIALTADPKGGFFTRTFDHISMFFKNLF